MAKKDIKFTLDTIDSRYSPVGTVKQLDSVFFYIKITENGVTKDLTGQTIKLFAIKEDKKIVEQTTKINITNQREGLIEIELLNAAIQVHGFTYFELEISDSNGIISTSDFILRVNKRVGSDEAIESTNEVAALKKIEEYVAQAKVELQEFKKLQTEMLKTNETINNQEDLRADAELQRVEAENARAIAEEERKSAEQTREENFTQFENKINANTEELKTARTATTGENFNSVDERIDHEVERLNKKIEVSFIQQEDKKNHKVENTIVGMTTDMVIKGKTMYKKSDGSYTDTWEEGVTIESFGEAESNKISILSCGKNLFNKETDLSAWWCEADKLFKEESTSNKYSVLIKISPNCKYTKNTNTSIASYIFLDEHDNVVGHGNSTTTSTAPSNAKKLLWYLEPGGISRELKETLQIEEGAEKTSYQAYECDKKDILLQEFGFDEGLRGLYEVLFDELNSIMNMAIKRIEKYVFTGNEEFLLVNTYGDVTRFDFALNDVKPLGKILSNNFVVGSIGTNNLECINVHGSSKYVQIQIKTSKLSTPDIEGFKNWLKSNQTTIYYELENPIETPLDENINVKTFGEKTYISFENSISGASSFKAPVNAAATISRLSRENKALEEENLSLRQDLESTTLALTDSDLELVKQNVDMDFRLMEVEFALDIPQAILSSDINFKNKKGEVKTMARTPYEMMKIVILSGDYDREDYMHKVGKYYERGRMTKEEHDELMSLMTADEVLSK